jgi:CRP-like cAMP-binding protein
MSLEEAIGQSYITQGFTEEDLQELYKIAVWREYADGEELLRQFDASRDLLILAQGLAHVHAVVGEPIAIVKPGMPIGEVSFVDARPRSVSVVSVGVSAAVLLPFELLSALLDARPVMAHRFLLNVSRVLCMRLRSANNNIAALLAIEESESSFRQ